MCIFNWTGLLAESAAPGDGESAEADNPVASFQRSRVERHQSGYNCILSNSEYKFSTKLHGHGILFCNLSGP